ncbi:helix-turn-helix domain-containing protein [Phyllobacterium myrsinacearum]|uniref:Transcriptional regulator with XRE-family HTH domain n=1 Tax=Phyllobacterium myrsinacearum TaxID=28101 RepID=A0A839EUP9_9HYPH|nr:helix-turn-helix domain-containing protein [Phyllobacterium myrsinacearum]MBA8880290.1 transcriptional regulator with XRE-family HTH domain [Phyllobacterium myrsinacearum]
MNFPGNIMTDIPDADTLGGRLSRARDAKSMTVKELAGRIGVRMETLAAWESDRSEPRANRLFMLAGFLGVTPTWLMHGVGQSPDESETVEGNQELKSQIANLKVLHQALGERIGELEKAVLNLKAA